MIEQGIAAIAADFEASMVDWDDYRKCPTCRAETGSACRSMSGRVAGGRPDGEAFPLPHAHVARLRRKRR